MSLVCFCFFKQKTAYEMRISDWSSDVCSSDLVVEHRLHLVLAVVKGAFEGDIEDVRRQHGGHLAALHLGDATHGVQHEDVDLLVEIGRASCRERVCQYV